MKAGERNEQKRLCMACLSLVRFGIYNSMEVQGMQYKRIRWGINVIFRVCPQVPQEIFAEFVLDQHAYLLQLSMFYIDPCGRKEWRKDNYHESICCNMLVEHCILATLRLGIWQLDQVSLAGWNLSREHMDNEKGCHRDILTFKLTLLAPRLNWFIVLHCTVYTSLTNTAFIWDSDDHSVIYIVLDMNSIRWHIREKVTKSDEHFWKLSKHSPHQIPN